MNTPKAIASDTPVFCSHDALVDIEDLKENVRNPNTHSDRQIALLAKNIRNFGWRKSITVSKRSGFIVSGHGRLQAARLLKVSLVPVDYQDFSSDAEEYAILLADNRLAELSYPDTKLLKDLMSDLDGEMGLKDIELTGFTEDEWKGLMATGEIPPVSDEGDPQGVGKECECPKCGHRFKPKAGKTEDSPH